MHRFVQMRTALVLAIAGLLWVNLGFAADPLLDRNPFVPPGFGQQPVREAPPPPPPPPAQPLTVAFTGSYTTSSGERKFTLFNESNRQGLAVTAGKDAFGVTVLDYLPEGGEGGRPALRVNYGGRVQVISMRDTSGTVLPVTTVAQNQQRPQVPAVRNLTQTQRSRVQSLNPNNNAGENVPRPRIRRRVVIPPTNPSTPTLPSVNQN
ncbi:MAG: hypothetical protein ACFBZ8_11950 [Opitutales bacterium]